MNEFSEALALAKLVAEKTGVSTERAIKALACLGERTTYTDMETLIACVQNLPSRSIGWTQKEVLGAHPELKLPENSKMISAAFKHIGWVKTSNPRRFGLTVWGPPA